MTLGNWNTLGQYGQRWPHDAGQTLRLWTSHSSLYVTANRLLISLFKTNSYPKKSLLTAHFRKRKVLIEARSDCENLGGGKGCELGQYTLYQRIWENHSNGKRQSERWAKEGVLGCTGTGAAWSWAVNYPPSLSSYLWPGDHTWCMLFGAGKAENLS